MTSRSLLPAVVLSTVISLTVGASEFEWAPSFEAAKEKAASEGKAENARLRLIMLVFTSQSCPYCTKLKAETLSDPTVQAALKGIVPVEVTPASPGSQELSRRFGVSGVPATFFIDSEDGLVGKVAGFVPPAKFIEEVKQARRAANEFREKLARYNDAPSAASSVELVDGYLQRQQADKLGDLIIKSRELIDKDEAITHNQRMLLRARLHIAEAFYVLKDAGTQDKAIEILAKAEGEARLVDSEIASRAAFLQGFLNLQADRLEEGAGILETVAEKYPDTSWAAYAQQYLDAVKAEITRRKAKPAPQP